MAWSTSLFKGRGHKCQIAALITNGAVNAAVYLAKKEPGLYDMGDLIAAL